MLPSWESGTGVGEATALAAAKVMVGPRKQGNNKNGKRSFFIDYVIVSEDFEGRRSSKKLRQTRKEQTDRIYPPQNRSLALVSVNAVVN